jgi:flagellar biosynthesis anti-sigma factor FlgM
MNITNTQVNQVSPVSLQKVTSGSVRVTGQSSTSDELIMSKLATEAQAVKQRITGLPEVRTDLVEHIKDAISDGSYQVSGSEVASSMFSDTKSWM